MRPVPANSIKPFRPHACVVIIMVLGAAASSSSGATLTGPVVLDQEYAPSSITMESGFSAPVSKGQTFAVGITGVLDGIDL
jgi:hypothetical protein